MPPERIIYLYRRHQLGRIRTTIIGYGCYALYMSNYGGMYSNLQRIKKNEQNWGVSRHIRRHAAH